MTRPNDEQVGGSHYKDMAVQPWDAMRAWMTAEQFAGYLLGNVIKYASRHRSKGGIEDLRKARHYLDKLIETKEVMQTEPVHRSSGINTVTAPAVSESAAGDAQQAINYGVADWPGPDWSQAPEGTTGWIIVPKWTIHDKNHSKEMVACWLLGRDDAPIPGAPLFGYTGDWRDSMRERPK